MASWTEPPKTPEWRSLSQHSTCAEKRQDQTVPKDVKEPLHKPPGRWGHRKASYLYEEVTDSPEAISDAGLRLAQPVVIRDAHVVHTLEEGILPGIHQLVQALRARLLHSLEAEFDVDWQLLLVRGSGVRYIIEQGQLK